MSKVALFCCLIVSIRIAAQTSPLQISRFEVASIRPIGPQSFSIDLRVYPGGRLNATAMNLRGLIMYAYDVQKYQVLGGPSWVDTDRFDIEAKADSDLSQDEVVSTYAGQKFPRSVLLMLQNLLAERFGLTLHRESRSASVYRLIVAQSNGPRLTPTTHAAEEPELFRGRGRTTDDRRILCYVMWGQNVSMSMLAKRLSTFLENVVIDETRLTGNYDFSFEYAVDETQPDSCPSIYTAIQEQIGLKLESAKGPVETLVIDAVHRPTEN